MNDKITKVLLLTIALNDAVDMGSVHYNYYYTGNLYLIDVTKFVREDEKCSVLKEWRAYADLNNSDNLLDEMIEQLKAELKEVTNKNDTN